MRRVRAETPENPPRDCTNCFVVLFTTLIGITTSVFGGIMVGLKRFEFCKTDSTIFKASIDKFGRETWASLTRENSKEQISAAYRAVTTEFNAICDTELNRGLMTGALIGLMAGVGTTVVFGCIRKRTMSIPVVGPAVENTNVGANSERKSVSEDKKNR